MESKIELLRAMAQANDMPHKTTTPDFAQGVVAGLLMAVSVLEHEDEPPSTFNCYLPRPAELVGALEKAERAGQLDALKRKFKQ